MFSAGGTKLRAYVQWRRVVFRSAKVLASILSTKSHGVQFVTFTKWTFLDRGFLSSRETVNFV